jgi:subtilisin family serine protease
MTRLLTLPLAAMLLLATGCASLPPADTAEPTPDAAEQQLLVMVKERAVQHYRPGPASLSGYGSGAARARALRTARDLARDYGLKPIDDWPMPALGVRCFLMELPRGRGAAEVAARLSQDPRVESAQPQQLFRVAGHDDPYYALQVGAQELQLDALHRMATGRGVKVAQIDTGLDAHHPDLEGQLTAARNFVDGTRHGPEVHGTAVAGIIVAKADNGIGIVGMAPGARLMPLRACWEPADGGHALCTTFTLAKAMQFALIERARVINLSLTGPRDRLLERLIDSAAQDGAIVVAALDAGEPAGFPASYPGVIAVAVSGSTSAPEDAVLAPGRDILTTTPGASWGFFSGSSFAAAHVSGLAALMLERAPSLKPEQLHRLLLQHQAVSASGGARALDACAALAQAAPARDCACCNPEAAHRVRGRGNIPAS